MVVEMTTDGINAAKKLILKEQFGKAKKILTPLAEENDANAQLILGYLYYGGDSDTSAEQAEYWLQKSSDNGNAEAMFYVATTNFKQGHTSDTPKDSESFPLLLEAAQKGSAEAQRSLAIMYAHGEFVSQDDEKTMYWDEKAAKQGLAESQHDLALMLLLGRGGVADIPMAIYWYEKAAGEDHNVPYAQWAAEELARIYSGEHDTEYVDDEKASYWRKRAKFLDTVNFRSHPDWFYEEKVK